MLICTSFSVRGHGDIRYKNGIVNNQTEYAYGVLFLKADVIMYALHLF